MKNQGNEVNASKTERALSIVIQNSSRFNYPPKVNRNHTVHHKSSRVNYPSKFSHSQIVHRNFITSTN